MRTGGFSEAVTFYSRGIDLDANNHLLFSNRALAYLKLKKHSEALADADACIGINPSFVKAYSTKGVALTFLGRASEARAAYQKGGLLVEQHGLPTLLTVSTPGLDLDPEHATIKANLARLGNATQTAPAAAAAGSLVSYLKQKPLFTLQSLVRLFMAVNMVSACFCASPCFLVTCSPR